MSNSKYEITDIAHKTYPFLHRIRALQDIGDWAKAGDLGGFVESESNLAVDPDDAAWIFNDAIACGSAYVDQDSILMNDAIACDRAYVSYGSALYGSARVEDDAYLRGALMYGRTRASGCAQLLCGADRAEGPLFSGHCQVFGTVRGCLRFSGSIIVLPHEEISNDLKDITVHISDSGRRVLRSKDKDILKPQQEQSPQAKKPKKRGMER